MDFDSLSTLLRENGIVGCGGAGFPSYAKLSKNVDTLVINCAECEPLLRLHRQLIEKRTVEILQTATKVAEIIGAKQVIVGIKAAYTKAVDSLQRNVGNYPTASIKLLDEVYPAGDEVILIYETTGRVIAPGKLPASVNVIVFNVETIYNMYRAMNGRPVTHKYVTITGEVATPKTFYAPIGSKLYGLIKRCGGATISDPEYLVGGPMMGYLGTENEVVTKTTNAIILLPKNHTVVMKKRSQISIDIKRAMAACSQCRYCTDMCPRHMLGHPIQPSELMRVISNSDSKSIGPYLGTMFCSQCGVCEMYACHQGLSPRTLIGEVKKKLRAAGVKAPDINKSTPIEGRELRRVPIGRLIQRLDLEKYNKPAPMYEDPINAKEVVIMLSQHIGVPAIPVVKLDDYVKEGQLIAIAQEGKLSVNIHASIDGTIVDITDRYITVRK